MRHHSALTSAPQRSVTRPSPRRSRRHDRPEAALAIWECAEPERLVVEVRRDLPRPLVIVAGELDLDSAGLLGAMLDHVRRSRRGAGSTGPGRADVDVDLAGVTFADSHGVAVLDGRTRVVAVSEPVRRLLHLLGQPSPAFVRGLSESAGRPA